MDIYFITTSYSIQIYFIITSYMKYGWLWWRIVDTAQNPKNLIIRNLANLSQPWNLTFFEHVAGIFQNIGLLQLRVAGIFETIGLFQLRLPAVWGHWYKNCHYDSLWEWWVFLRPQGCSNWGCPPFEVIGLTIVTVILFQSGGYFWDHRIAPTEAARRLRELDYQLSL